ncbi:disintegrin and metalloproteinase domain-containing protein 33-like [Cydia pomonella]|uniref:disintegrin and metalloproteinase domain-containing protein 33-like n=1 Tax=Cydia pomonella TaxID=82600 RepID=UPI002ADD832B|nr:disintegrin and metalloproteinase domain-containing protein 33-like [Cydia pomonella]
MLKNDALALWYLCFVCSLILLDLTSYIQCHGHPSTDFIKHNIVKPTLQHGRTKREITSTKDVTGTHHRDVIITVSIDGEEQVLELQLNEVLVPRGHSLIYQQDGRSIVHVPKREELDLCQYMGRVRGKQGSWAAVSTCDGVQGVIYDGQQLRYIEPAHGDINGEHFLYSHEHLTRKHHCGYQNGSKQNFSHNPHNSVLFQQGDELERKSNRDKRHAFDNTLVQEPYNANKRSRYVELVLVVDHGEYLASGQNIRLVHRHMKDLANIINSVYAPLHIFISLVGVEVWTEVDKITLDMDSQATLNNFNKYRSTDLVHRIPNDNAHLLSRQKFKDGVVGKAHLGMICSNEKSAGVETNHSGVFGIVAMTIAHEMGHNFGMGHDDEQDGCVCPDKRCIMSSYTSDSIIPVRWSSCSLRNLSRSFEKGLDYCLRNIPKRLFESPTCGNGFLEEGEECDCGTSPGAFSPKDSDRNACTACCKPDCTLRANATCGHGQCCDIRTCRPKAPGTECRTANSECDLPEFCNGNSPFCPQDVHKMDATPCRTGQAYCVRGACRTHTDQCRLLWGITGERSDDACYNEHNVHADEYGNCGYDRVSQRFRSCSPQDALCGMLQCTHLGENKIHLGDIYTARMMSYPAQKGRGMVVPCHTAIIDFGLRDVDPGLVPDGAKCGPDKMCMQQRCVSVERVREKAQRAAGSICPSNCSEHGVCNSNGNCHCSAGYAPPQCARPGAGGSQDSGPAADTHDLSRFMVAMYIIFLGIVPAIILVLVLIYFCACCSPLRFKIFKSHYSKPTNIGSKFALPNINSFKKWFYDSDEVNRGNCKFNVNDDKENKIVTVKNKFDGHKYKEICYVDIPSTNVAKSVVHAQSNKKNVTVPVKLKYTINKEDIVIVEKYNHAPVHNKTSTVANNLDVIKPKVDDMKNKYESLTQNSNSNIPNIKDLNKELTMHKNSKMSPINRPKPNLNPKPANQKPSVSPKPGVNPKPNRLPKNRPKPGIINAGLASTTNEFLNQRSKLRKVGNVNVNK